MTSCQRTSHDQPRTLRGQHAEGCTHQYDTDSLGCLGCQPCPHTHCGTCGHRHTEQLTCPECVGQARENITEIVRMCGELPEEVETKGAASEALHLIGPTAQPEAWRQRRRYGYRDEAEVRTKDGGIIGENHPEWVLGTWDLLVTEHYHHQRTARVTVVSAAGYLQRNLTDLAQDADFDFAALAGEVQACRTHLEAVLHDQAEGDRANVGCFECGGDLERRITDTGMDDAWTCRRCRRRYSYAEYNFALRAKLEAEVEKAG